MERWRYLICGTLCMAVTIVCFLCLLPGCDDKGASVPTEPLSWDATVKAGSVTDLEDVSEVCRMEEGRWGETTLLSEGTHWKWDETSRTLQLSSRLQFPCWLQVTGRSGGEWYSFVTRLETGGSAVAAHEVTTLISAEYLQHDALTLEQAQASIKKLFHLSCDPFGAVGASGRPDDLARAVQSLVAHFRGRSADEAARAVRELDLSSLEILPTGPITAVMADILVDPDKVPVAQAVSFIDLSLGNYDTCTWDFGDGSAASGDRNATHTFTSTGLYTVTLTLKQAGVLVATTTCEVSCFDPLNPPPLASFLSDKTWGDLPLAVGFTDTSTGDIWSYSWDFGDGSRSSEISPSHTFSSAGRHVVTLTVTGPGGISRVRRVISAGEFIAVAATAAPDFTSGAHSVIPVATRIPANRILPTTSDITMVARGAFFYRIERYMHDNVTKFSIDEPDKVIWQYSALGPEDGSSCNPHDLVFVNDTKAYLIRYGSQRAWIVNPSAISASGFKIGEVDLSVYGDEDGLPEMTRGVIVGDRLFIAMERMNRLSSNGIWQPHEAYVAVIDTATDREIETGCGGVNDVTGVSLKGIPLVVENPISMQYLPENNTIYIQAVGTYPMTSFLGKDTGGIEAINPDTYERLLVLDDGDRDDGPLPFGNISGMAVVSPKKGYFVGYKGWMDNTFYAFEFDEAGRADLATVRSVPGLSGKNIAVLESGASLDNRGKLWVCNRTDGGVSIIDPFDDSTEDFIVTGLPPLKVVYCVKPGEGG